MFLLGRIGDREVPDDVLDELEVHQRETLRVLDELDAKPPTTEARRASHELRGGVGADRSSHQ
jgi:hypothetical protein